jgi:hypothetical protein
MVECYYSHKKKHFASKWKTKIEDR